MYHSVVGVEDVGQKDFSLHVYLVPSLTTVTQMPEQKALDTLQSNRYAGFSNFVGSNTLFTFKDIHSSKSSVFQKELQGSKHACFPMVPKIHSN